MTAKQKRKRASLLKGLVERRATVCYSQQLTTYLRKWLAARGTNAGCGPLLRMQKDRTFEKLLPQDSDQEVASFVLGALGA